MPDGPAEWSAQLDAQAAFVTTASEPALSRLAKAAATGDRNAVQEAFLALMDDQRRVIESMPRLYHDSLSTRLGWHWRSRKDDGHPRFCPCGFKWCGAKR